MEETFTHAFVQTQGNKQKLGLILLLNYYLNLNKFTLIVSLYIILSMFHSLFLLFTITTYIYITSILKYDEDTCKECGSQCERKLKLQKKMFRDFIPHTVLELHCIPEPGN